MLPSQLLLGIEKITQQGSHKQLVEVAKSISEKYRFQTGQGKILVSKEQESIAYAISRMPATYEAVSNVINQIIKRTNKVDYETLLDIGAGTGAATWAVNSILNIKQNICLERENSMIKVGKQLMELGDEPIKSTIWKNFDLLHDKIDYVSDIVICSYVLNEFKDEDRLKAVEKLWMSTKDILIIIEPGTPKNFQQILKLKEFFSSKGAFIIAPCPKMDSCPLKDTDDWCNFSCRVARTKLHKQMKNGESPFEDERFTYIVVSKNKIEPSKGRILKHPFYKPKIVMLEVCNGYKTKKTTISKSNKNYKQARDLKIGDEIDYDI